MNIDVVPATLEVERQCRCEVDDPEARRVERALSRRRVERPRLDDDVLRKLPVAEDEARVVQPVQEVEALPPAMPFKLGIRCGVQRKNGR